jgi:hypothetical protein
VTGQLTVIIARARDEHSQVRRQRPQRGAVGSGVVG